MKKPALERGAGFFVLAPYNKSYRSLLDFGGFVIKKYVFFIFLFWVNPSYSIEVLCKCLAACSDDKACLWYDDFWVNRGDIQLPTNVITSLARVKASRVLIFDRGPSACVSVFGYTEKEIKRLDVLVSLDPKFELISLDEAIIENIPSVQEMRKRRFKQCDFNALFR